MRGCAAGVTICSEEGLAQHSSGPPPPQQQDVEDEGTPRAPPRLPRAVAEAGRPAGRSSLLNLIVTVMTCWRSCSPRRAQSRSPFPLRDSGLYNVTLLPNVGRAGIAASHVQQEDKQAAHGEAADATSCGTEPVVPVGRKRIQNGRDSLAKIS